MRDSHTISRATEYFTESELTRQIGGGNKGKTDWVLFVLKELVDNALDAIESEKNESPEIFINIGEDSFSDL
jgi:DNA topoisomerase VI subunit B